MVINDSGILSIETSKALNVIAAIDERSKLRFAERVAGASGSIPIQACSLVLKVIYVGDKMMPPRAQINISSCNAAARSEIKCLAVSSRLSSFPDHNFNRLKE